MENILQSHHVGNPDWPFYLQPTPAKQTLWDKPNNMCRAIEMFPVYQANTNDVCI